MKEMNILYAIDEWKKDYSRYLWVSILSLLENNKEENVHIYILSQYIEESNKKELIRIVNEYWKKISFSEWEIVPEKFVSVLSVEWDWRRPMATYYRFFFLNKFDIKDRVLYLDCDTIVNKSLSEFYYSDFEWNAIIWQSDIGLTSYGQKKKYSLKEYINAWVYLYNVDSFREIDLYKKIKKVNDKFGHPNYNDQDYINIIFKDKIKIVDKLQLLSCFYFYSDYTDYFVIHTTQKPNAWWYEYCPEKIEQLFNKYLEQTKWKTWLWYKKHISIKEYCNHLYDFITKSLAYTAYNIFGTKAWVFVTNTQWNIYNWVYKVLKFLRIK